ncbi:hypothetical protein HMPREF0208_00102 [Citrobacter koseri]|uniref:Uncharacterized protein n=1 Tax=Citrobacter koseri (strain ATCC BAA-895 / CDC 4225-83 / SGSC4696) TaxID=290338 RepID=A8AJ65_CITK8|nr:hypothetical protein CKO_02411 [Citrobacter koseri ATCC BAA-895]KXA02399.1 hypothetical protein HMPREF3220_00924 [Citrobacter koseri]KXA05743.1 hypothetical protein HMPREF3207_00657 [Citrobacter koseri]KXB47458.1 hypothetical protein HMPREF0208_00102 [Citrobacter koseri]
MLPFTVAVSSSEETAMIKSYKHVNKKPKLIPQIYYAVKSLQ